MKKVFTKEHSREYSLFRVSAWYKSMIKWLPYFIGLSIDEACLVYRGKDLVDVYYEPLSPLFEHVAKSSQNIEKTKQQIKDFLKLFSRLKPYFTKEKAPQNIKELKKIYELYSRFWAFIAVIFVIPTLPSINPELKKMAQEAREKTQEYNEAMEPVFKKFLEEKFPHLRSRTRFVLPEEVWSGEIKKGNFVDKIMGRKKGFIYYKGKVYTGNLEENLDALGIILEDKESAVSGKAIVSRNQIKGQVAYKGKVTGKVKIVSSIKDLPKVGYEDILVAAMTMPKYLPAMKKAAAFVTDEGGITCHAAIVSREMNKPCIIGTKIATKVLKDGDLVEVDANKGTVRILKKE